MHQPYNNQAKYVCVVLDLFSRKVIAWRVSDKIDTQLVMETAEEAYLKRGRPQSVLFHSDRGCQYTSELFRRFSDQRNIVQSFSAPGYPYDNAVVESFFKFFKKEELNSEAFSRPGGIEAFRFCVY
ncbi:DDE-type integrase/transposase/recombinase [Fretibacterium fastidiosum]|uniref:DDE-type integrase/transposase/recombinase n=1 Tax=Fretibacterium fastidiosum TaxID=651822 RepID=UPI0038FCCDCA